MTLASDEKTMRPALRVTLLGLLLLASTQVQAQSISGPAKVVDGDTLEMNGSRIRLFAIDAPEGGQTCNRDGAPWACGDAAKAQLEELVGGIDIKCVPRDTDQYGRIVATCRAGYADLGEAMVLTGLAVAYREFGPDYADAEDRAKRFKLGMWAGTFERPSEWRLAHPQTAPQPAMVKAAEPTRPQPAARVWRDGLGRCAIKGNHSRRGDWIYHLPGQPYYNQTRPEALFCTEDEALRAGYRPSRAR